MARLLAILWLLTAVSSADSLAILCAGALELVDASSLRVTRTVVVGAPQCLDGHPTGAVLVVGGGDDTLTVFQMPSGDVVDAYTNPYFEDSVGLLFAPDGQSFYLLSRGVKALLQVSLGGEVMKVLPLAGPAPQALSRGQESLLVVQSQGWVTQVDPRTWEVVRQDTFVQPLGGAVVAAEKLVVSHPDPGQVRFLAQDTRAEVGVAVTGPGAGVLRSSPDRALVVVANRLSDDLVALDPTEGRRRWRVAIGSRPVDIAFSPDGKWVYAVNAGSNDLSVVEAETSRELGRLPLKPGPRAIVYIKS